MKTPNATSPGTSRAYASRMLSPRSPRWNDQHQMLGNDQCSAEWNLSLRDPHRPVLRHTELARCHAEVQRLQFVWIADGSSRLDRAKGRRAPATRHFRAAAKMAIRANAWAMFAAAGTTIDCPPTSASTWTNWSRGRSKVCHSPSSAGTLPAARDRAVTYRESPPYCSWRRRLL